MSIALTSFLDPVVVGFRDYFNGGSAQEAIDQAAMYYKQRPAGPEYMPPFTIANMNYCNGLVSEIEGEEPFPYLISVLDQVGRDTDEMTKDRALFFSKDLSHYDTRGEVLHDPQLVTGGKGTIIRSYPYHKKMCQEMWPEQPTIKYGEPFEFYER